MYVCVCVYVLCHVMYMQLCNGVWYGVFVCNVVLPFHRIIHWSWVYTYYIYCALCVKHLLSESVICNDCVCVCVSDRNAHIASQKKQWVFVVTLCGLWCGAHMWCDVLCAVEPLCYDENGLCSFLCLRWFTLHTNHAQKVINLALLKNWKPTKSMVEVLFAIRTCMIPASKLKQPAMNAEY